MRFCHIPKKVSQANILKKSREDVDHQLKKIMTAMQLYVYDLVKFLLRGVLENLCSKSMNQLFKKVDYNHNTRSTSAQLYKIS